jgi:hypothetical protein
MNSIACTSRSFTQTLAVLWILSGDARATEFEKLGDAIAGALGTTQAFSKSVKGETLYYSKNPQGAPSRVAVIEKGIYEPNCTHTWVIGVDLPKHTVSGIRVHEMSCPHAFPTRAAAFLDQFKGKGPQDLAKLHREIDTIAKATGSSKLTTDAVVRAIQKRWKPKEVLRSTQKKYTHRCQKNICL